MSEYRVHLVEPELIVPGRHRRVRREHALLLHSLYVLLGGITQWRAVEAAFKQTDGKQRRVTFVHVADFRLGSPVRAADECLPGQETVSWQSR